MDDEIAKLREKQKEELEQLKSRHKEKMAQLRAKEKKRKSKELSENRRTLARLDHIMGALVRKRIKPQQYIEFMQNSADPRDRDFAVKRYSHWLKDEDNNTRESYDLTKSLIPQNYSKSRNHGDNTPRLI